MIGGRYLQVDADEKREAGGWWVGFFTLGNPLFCILREGERIACFAVLIYYLSFTSGYYFQEVWLWLSLLKVSKID